MTREEALKWIAGVFEEAPETIKPETPRAAIATWDSLGVLTLMAALDETFDLVVNDDDMRVMMSVGDILRLLEQHGKLD